MVYPGGRSSIRFERVIEGIQQTEKLRILREEYAQKGNTAALRQLNNVISTFVPGTVNAENPSSQFVNRLENLLNERCSFQLEKGD